MLGPTESRSSENRSKAGVLSRDHGEYFRETVMDADEKVKILQAFVNANKEAKKRMAISVLRTRKKTALIVAWLSINALTNAACS